VSEDIQEEKKAGRKGKEGREGGKKVVQPYFVSPAVGSAPGTDGATESS